MPTPACHDPLLDLVSVGPATRADLHELGIDTLDELAAASARDLYERLMDLRGGPVDICCLDVFQAAIAQARDPDLPAEARQWWYWSRRRKAADAEPGPS